MVIFRGVPVELLNEEFLEWVLKAANRDELADHQEYRADRLSEDSPQQIDNLEICLTRQHDSVQVGQQFGALWELIEPLLRSDLFEVLFQLLFEVVSCQGVPLIQQGHEFEFIVHRLVTRDVHFIASLLQLLLELNVFNELGCEADAGDGLDLRKQRSHQDLDLEQTQGVTVQEATDL